ncbi:MAG: hypothetical protein WCO09_00260 [bacterium]
MTNQLELSSYERKILISLALPGTLTTIACRLSTPRSTIEYNIDKLLSKKLITFSLSGKRKIYNLTTQKTKGHELFPPSPIVKIGPITIYSGGKAIETLWQEVAKQSRGSRLIGVQPSKSFKEAIKKASKETLHGVSQAITDKRFIIDSIVHGDLTRSVFNQFNGVEARSIAKVFTGRLEDMVKVDPSFLDEKSEMFIIGNFSFFIDWFKEVAIKIENQNINHLLLSLYQATKAYGKRYEQSRDIERVIGGR